MTSKKKKKEWQAKLITKCLLTYVKNREMLNSTSQFCLKCTKGYLSEKPLVSRARGIKVQVFLRGRIWSSVLKHRTIEGYYQSVWD